MGNDTSLCDYSMNRLRKIIQYHVTNQGYTWYRLAEDTGIRHASLYRFRDGGGLDGDNTIKLMAHFKLNPEELI